MEKTNEIIKSFDYSNSQIDLLIAALGKDLDYFRYTAFEIKKGTKIFRARKQDNLSNLFSFESDLSYRLDIKNIENFGRCNLEHSSKFYGSPHAEDFDGDVTVMAETSALSREGIDGCETYSIGMWEARETVSNLFAIKPPFDEKKESVFYKELIREFEVAFPRLDNSHQEFYELIGKEFAKKVKKNEGREYAISAAVSEVLTERTNGVVYSSVQTESQGINVVMNPEKFDHFFKFVGLGVGVLFKFKNQIEFCWEYECRNPLIQPFKYLPVAEESRMLLPELIYRFERLGIDKEYIISKLVEQSSGKIK